MLSRAMQLPRRMAWASVVTTRDLFVKMEGTPNPDSMKFIPVGAVVLPEALGSGLVRAGVGVLGCCRRGCVRQRACASRVRQQRWYRAT